MIIFDEIKYAEHIIKYGCSRKYILVDFKILAKYFLLYKHYSEEEAMENMLSVLKDKQSIIPLNYLPQKIDLSIKYAKTEDLKLSSAIHITQEELEKIDSLPESVRELAFIYLFLWKWNKDTEFFIDKSDLKKLLKLSGVANYKLDILDGELEKLGFIKFVDYCRKEKVAVNLEQSDVSDLELTVEDFDNVILYYRQHCGKKVIKCEDCGCLVEVRSNRQKYCKNCSTKHRTENLRVYKKRSRANKSL